MTLKYFSILNNKPLASWVAHITIDILTFYSCSYYSSTIQLNKQIYKQANKKKSKENIKKKKNTKQTGNKN